MRTVRILSLAFALAASASPAAAQSPLYEALWTDPAVEQRIEHGIRAHRMSWGTLELVDAAGNPVPNVDVRVEQRTHDFLFGANAFMASGYAEAEKNRRWEEAYARIFNSTTAPFYLKHSEVERGKPRFGIESEPIYRRPPPDAVLDFARRHGITVKGHPLMWHSLSWHIPDWWPQDPDSAAAVMRQRMERIAERYSDDILVWDVVNEALTRNPDQVLPDDYVFQAFKLADRLFPLEATLLINEVTSHSWTNYRGRETPYYLLIDNLLRRGARIDAIGMQVHFFSEELWANTLAGEAMRPSELFRAMDLLADFNRPLHVTEITIPTLPNDPAGERAQGRVTRDFYRAWFSHPNVEAITWWNLVDGTAVPGEDRWRGGLLREDFSRKPAYDALDRLINQEWTTRLTTRAGADSKVRFQGFHGAYDVTATHAGRTVTQRVHLRKGGENRFVMRIGT